MHILAIQPNAQLTGSPRSLYEICDAYGKHSVHNFTIFFLREGEVIEEFRANNFDVISLNPYFQKYRILNLIALIFYTFLVYRGSVIMLNSSATVRGLLIVLLARSRSFVYVREFDQMMGKLSLIRLFLLRYVKNIISLTAANSDWLIAKVLYKNSISVIGNFINDEWRDDTYLNNIKLKLDFVNNRTNRPTICIVGKMDYRKGIDFFLDLLVLQQDIYNFLIIGDVHESCKLSSAQRTLISDAIARGNLLITGMCKDPRIYYKNSHVYVCLSRSEVFSRSIIEAQFLGIPVIAWNLQTHNSLIPPENTVKFGDINSLIDKLESILLNYPKSINDALNRSIQFNKESFVTKFNYFINSKFNTN